MAKTAKSAKPTITRDLTPDRTTCPHCGGLTRADYANRRTFHTLAGVTRLSLTIRRCHHTDCVASERPYRPEAEGAVALPRHEFGLDVIALIGRLRYAEHRSVPEIRMHLVGCGVSVTEQTVSNLLDRYDELLAVARPMTAGSNRFSRRKGRWSWLWMDSSPMWNTRPCGSSATCSAARSC